MVSDLYTRAKYNSPIPCLIGKDIRVYDISKANISVLRQLGIISEEMYNHLFCADKMEREVTIGRLIGDNPLIGTSLANGILDMRRKFLEMNELSESDILEADNDSLAVINHLVRYQQVGDFVTFRLAEVYTSFYRVRNIKYFYLADMINNTEFLRLKGMDKSKHLHEDYMVDFLKELFYQAQFNGPKSAIELISDFHNQYVSRSIHYGYYRELNARSLFRIKQSISNYGSYYVEMIADPRVESMIDISYNENILREFIKLFSAEYFQMK